MQTIQLVREQLTLTSPSSPMNRCNFSTSSASSSSNSSIEQQSSLSSIGGDQQRVKQQRPSSKRFFVSRVQPQLPPMVRTIVAPNEQQQPQQRVAQSQRADQQQRGASAKELLVEKKQHQPPVETPLGQAGQEELISFRYTWPVRISERLIGAGERAILNVSPPFCTAYNGVQFTWLLRICEENILDFGCSGDGQLEMGGGKKKVNITLYYKEGPARDVRLNGGNISIRNSRGLLFENMALRELEYTKGGGWSPICAGANAAISAEQRKFSEFIHSHIGRQITVRIKLDMPAALFQPMQYLPSIESPVGGDRLEALCATVLDQIRANQILVPDVEYFDMKIDKYALYRHVYQFACQEIQRRFVQFEVEDDQEHCHELMEKIRNIFAHYYFNTVIVPEAECFEDFLEALDASRHVQFPALRRECERYICAEVMAESADLTLVKKMLLLAERFNLSVLKMVSCGVIIDRLLLQQANDSTTSAPQPCHHHQRGQQSTDSGAGGPTIESSMEEIREELLEMAEQIIHPNEAPNASSRSPLKLSQRKHTKSLCSPKQRLSTSSSAVSSDGNQEDSEGNSSSDDEEEDDDDNEVEQGGETLVGSVISQLEELARHIRKVSMPPGVRPAPLQSDRPLSPQQVTVVGSPKSIQHLHGGGEDSGTGSMDSRRSSLKTGRDLLLQQHRPERSNSSGDAAMANGGGYSVADNNRFFNQLYGARLFEEDGGVASSSSESVQQQQPRLNHCPEHMKGGVKFAGDDDDSLQQSDGMQRRRKSGVVIVQQSAQQQNVDEDEGVVEDEPLE